MDALNRLTWSVTAFSTWGEFFAALARGYVPTIRPTTRRNRLLRRVVVAHGFRVWPN